MPWERQAAAELPTIQSMAVDPWQGLSWSQSLETQYVCLGGASGAASLVKSTHLQLLNASAQTGEDVMSHCMSPQMR